MEVIRTIDLWTEQFNNHQDIFNGAFVDGLESDETSYDEYKIVKNCNCIITSDIDINIRNKHIAIIFYKNNKPIRLVVINSKTDLKMCMNIALSQNFENVALVEYLNNKNIKNSIVDMNEQPIFNNTDEEKEPDVGSCDRWNLLYSLLKGSYTESNTTYGNKTFNADKYEFIHNVNIKYELKTDNEYFIIEHKCAFINELRTRIIPIQENSKLTNN